MHKTVEFQIKNTVSKKQKLNLVYE